MGGDVTLPGGDYETRFITVSRLVSGMPATLEVKCANDDCALDMFELHYTYDMPGDVGVEDFECPYCRSGDFLEAIEV